MVLSVWSVVAVDEVVWTTISGSWMGEERGGEEGTEDRMKGRVMGEERRKDRTKKGAEGRGKKEVGRVEKAGIIFGLAHLLPQQTTSY